MSKTLNDIQTSARIYARDGALVLTSGEGLLSVNRMYRQLVTSLPWPEFRRKDVSLATVAGTGSYTWPVDPIFQSIASIEMQDMEDNSNYKLIFPPPDEWTWNEAEAKASQSIPDHYMRGATATANEIEFRPTPKYAVTIRITGTIEPPEFVQGATRSAFINALADDAFEYLIAASWVERDGDPGWAQSLTQNAGILLRQMFDSDLVTDNILRRITQT